MFEIPFLLILIVLVALVFDFTNGAHDCANAIATVVSTKVVTPRFAVGMAAALNLAGALLGTEVAKTLGAGLVLPEVVQGSHILVLAALLYAGLLNRQMTNMLVPTAVYIVMAVSLNLVVGLLGELSLGHAGFMSVGLFSGSLVSIALSSSPLPLGLRLPLSMLAGGLVAAVFGLLVGLPALRLRGDYLAIVTLACGEIIKNIITNLNFTGGALGLNTSAIYAGAKDLLPYGAVLVMLTVAVMLNLKRSKYGRAIMAIRDNRIAAESVGLNVTQYKLAVFVIAAFFAGSAGVLYGHSLANIKAAAFDYNMSIEILVIVVLGGMGSIVGVVIAATILILAPEYLRAFSEYRMLLFGAIMVIMMIFRPQGLVTGERRRYRITALQGGSKGERA